jgi:chitinase
MALRRAGLAVLAALALAAGALPSQALAAQPVELAAPYEYLGWGDPQPPAEAMAASGVQDVTLAFILATRHGCTPAWDGRRPLLGGVDQAAIESVRAAGGDVDVSFGGWSGRKLGSACKSARALAAAYQQVISAYSLKAIDIDIEHKEMASRKARQRVVEALAEVQQANPGLEISITMGTEQSGPGSSERSLISQAAAISFQPTVWTVMPFDFGPPANGMADASIEAVEGLAADLAGAYHIATSAGYELAGISSMNGHTDEASETVGLEDFQEIANFATQFHLGRLSFWSINRDRPCKAPGEAAPEEECSGIAQAPYAFSSILASFHG